MGWMDLVGTTASSFILGIGGALLRSNSGTVEARSNDNSSYAPFKSSNLSVVDAATTQSNLGITRIVGSVQLYTGTDSTSQGYIDDFDGKWIYLTLDSIRTIGNASSGAAIAASWTQTLFTHLWTNYTQSQCPVLTSAGGASTRGASAAADWAANKRITLFDYRGRVIIGAGSGSSLTTRSKGAAGGEETHINTTTEIPAHNHQSKGSGFITNGTSSDRAQLASTGTGASNWAVNDFTQNSGGGGGHNNMQPYAAEHLLISAGAR
jgi:hypothetical protein